MLAFADPPQSSSVTSLLDRGKWLAVRSLFESVDADTLAAIESTMEWFSLPAGWTLFRQGDAGRDLYIVISGRLDATIRRDHEDEVVVARIGAGELVGEMALISGEPRSATVIARRDTELVRLSQFAFEALIESRPKAMLPLTRLVVRRLADATRGSTGTIPSRTLALLPLAKGLPVSTLAAGLKEALSALGIPTFVVNEGAANQETEWYDRIEENHGLVIYQAESSATDWTQFCLRQADHIFLLGRADAPPPDPATMALLTSELRRRCTLVVLSDAEASKPAAASSWHERRLAEFHCHVRLGNSADLLRLARLITGRAVSLVLSGGGARGFAHLGAIRALREAGISFDLVGGTSIGAIVAAGTALEWSCDELADRLRQAFVDTNPLSDYTLPIVSLVKGGKVTCLLREHFGETRIEDLWLPYYCVSSNLTTGTAAVHRRGPLWRALRASIAIPGVLPPVVEGGEVLVDGGVLNNFPVDVMRSLGGGAIIGVDVASGQALFSAPTALESTSLWSLLRNRGRRTPGILRLLMRAGTISSEMQARECRKMVTLLLEPPLTNIDLLSWRSFERAVEAGYQYTLNALSALDRRSLLFPIGLTAVL